MKLMYSKSGRFLNMSETVLVSHKSFQNVVFGYFRLETTAITSYCCSWCSCCYSWCYCYYCCCCCRNYSYYCYCCCYHCCCCCCCYCCCYCYSGRFLWRLYPLSKDAEEVALVAWVACACCILQDIWACGIICFSNGCKWLHFTTICLEVIVRNVSLDSKLVLSSVSVSN